jgi:acyl-[acyl-carrier-protein] desaturase
VLRNAWTPGEATIFEGMVYTAIQEKATQAFYVSVATQANAEDPILARLLRRIANDETLHYVFYRDAVKAYLEADPNKVEVVSRILQSFAMPGFGMPDFAQRQKIIAAGANYGIAEHFNKVVKMLMEAWDIKSLLPNCEQSLLALEKLNHYYDKMAKYAAVLDRRKLTADALQRQSESVRIAAAELLAVMPEFEISESGLLAPIQQQFR